MNDVERNVLAERARQRTLWPEDHDDNHWISDWLLILAKYIPHELISRLAWNTVERGKERNWRELEASLTKAAAVLISWAESCRRRAEMLRRVREHDYPGTR